MSLKLDPYFSSKAPGLRIENISGGVNEILRRLLTLVQTSLNWVLPLKTVVNYLSELVLSAG